MSIHEEDLRRSQAQRGAVSLLLGYSQVMEPDELSLIHSLSANDLISSVLLPTMQQLSDEPEQVQDCSSRVSELVEEWKRGGSLKQPGITTALTEYAADDAIQDLQLARLIAWTTTPVVISFHMGRWVSYAIAHPDEPAQADAAGRLADAFRIKMEPYLENTHKRKHVNPLSPDYFMGAAPDIRGGILVFSTNDHGVLRACEVYISSYQQYLNSGIESQAFRNAIERMADTAKLIFNNQLPARPEK